MVFTIDERRSSEWFAESIPWLLLHVFDKAMDEPGRLIWHWDVVAVQLQLRHLCHCTFSRPLQFRNHMLLSLGTDGVVTQAYIVLSKDTASERPA